MNIRSLCVVAFTAIFALIAENANAHHTTVALGDSVLASHYGHRDGFDGQQMANGRYFDKNDPQMAAHWTLPMCSQVQLKNPSNGRELTVVITDRGPHPRLRRDFDLSYAAAQQLGYINSGLVNLQVMQIIPPKSGWRWGQACDNYLN